MATIMLLALSGACSGTQSPMTPDEAQALADASLVAETLDIPGRWTTKLPVDFPDLSPTTYRQSASSACATFAADVAAARDLEARFGLGRAQRKFTGSGYYWMVVTAYRDSAAAQDTVDAYRRALSSDNFLTCEGTPPYPSAGTFRASREKAATLPPNGGFSTAQTVRISNGRDFEFRNEQYLWRVGTVVVEVYISREVPGYDPDDAAAFVRAARDAAAAGPRSVR
ncbi:MAG: hypothetical protein HY875_01205 [Chloroflexi bacterium]|nr:hypothetical protein [Chloroflexota bacterium]